jgi:purine-binding chemotaxis protein CheW
VVAEATVARPTFADRAAARSVDAARRGRLEPAMDSPRARAEAKERTSGAARLEGALRAELGAAAEAAAEREALSALAGGASDDLLDEFFWREDERAPALPDVLGAVPRPHGEVVEARREWVAFLLGDEEYAVEIERVREILKAPVITEVPRAPAHILGVIMVRGEVIAVFDPRRRLGLPAAALGRAARVLVCDGGDGPRGVLVDAVSEVVRLPASAIEPRPSGIGAASAECIVGIGRDRKRLLVLLDMAALLNDGSESAAREAAESEGEAA